MSYKNAGKFIDVRGINGERGRQIIFDVKIEVIDGGGQYQTSNNANNGVYNPEQVQSINSDPNIAEINFFAKYANKPGDAPNLKLSFHDSSTGALVTLPRFYVTFYDFDTNSDETAIETMCIPTDQFDVERSRIAGFRTGQIIGSSQSTDVSALSFIDGVTVPVEVVQKAGAGVLREQDLQDSIELLRGQTCFQGQNPGFQCDNPFHTEPLDTVSYKFCEQYGFGNGENTRKFYPIDQNKRTVHLSFKERNHITFNIFIGCANNKGCSRNILLSGAAPICDSDLKDTDNDGACDSADKCPNDPQKKAPGQCGCGSPDIDADKDGVADCKDLNLVDSLLVDFGTYPGANSGITGSVGIAVDTDASTGDISVFELGVRLEGLSTNENFALQLYTGSSCESDESIGDILVDEKIEVNDQDSFEANILSGSIPFESDGSGETSAFCKIVIYFSSLTCCLVQGLPSSKETSRFRPYL